MYLQKKSQFGLDPHLVGSGKLLYIVGLNTAELPDNIENQFLIVLSLQNILEMRIFSE